ncbi:MAG: hypothetical protein R2809_14465 [Flavobacteriales bacterium]
MRWTTNGTGPDSIQVARSLWKEWAVGKSGKNKTLGINLRLIYTGGLRNTY